jgi:hypothetical protein
VLAEPDYPQVLLSLAIGSAPSVYSLLLEALRLQAPTLRTAPPLSFAVSSLRLVAFARSTPALQRQFAIWG